MCARVTRVLIVDDDPLVREGLKLILATAPELRVVGEASDGAGAVRQATLHAPDVVLMDLRMNGMDGCAATEELMRLESPPKVLALTTFDADERVMATLDAGASGYLLKDTPPRDILDAIRETAAGRAVLSPRHTRLLLEGYCDNGLNAQRNRARRLLEELTAREREVVKLLSEGLTNAEIAEQLFCSPATVKSHLATIFVRLQVTNRVRLAIIGHDAGLLRDS